MADREPENVTLPDDREWLSAAVGAARMGISPGSFARVVRAGGIRRREYPGLQATYSAEDIARIIAESVKAGPHDPRRRGNKSDVQPREVDR